MVSNQVGIAMLMRFADCVPVFLFDPVKKAVGIYHAGWKGTVLKIGLEAVRVMVNEFESQPGDILAGVGPSIGPDHYQIGKDVVKKVRDSFPDLYQQLLVSAPDGVKLNLWEGNRLALNEAGVQKVEIARICTACDLDNWYSHRAENGKTGRFGALVMIDRESNDRDKHSE
jgi:YfiH family protein